MYLVSACLAGFNTRYDGTNSLDEKIRTLVAEGRAVPVCPEQLAGLPTPRTPLEFETGNGGALLEGKSKAVGGDGKDYTEALIKGAGEAVRIAGLYGIKEAILKDGSPSCGVTYVYCSGKRRQGRGVAAEALARQGIRVRTGDSL